MKRNFISGLAVSALLIAAPLGVATAADMAVKAPPPPPVYSWTGFYIGGSIGGIWANDNITDLDGLNAFQTYGLKSTGVIGSGVLGYNFQYRQFVFGIEADLGGMGLNKTMSEPNSGTPPVTSNNLGSGFYSDVTGRLGFVAAGALFYAKGGWAYFDGRANVNNTLGGFGGGVVTTGPFTDGWTVGAGIEYAFTPAWSVKVEYQHFDFGSNTATLVTPANGNFRFPNDLTADALKVGVNYHFGH